MDCPLAEVNILQVVPIYTNHDVDINLWCTIFPTPKITWKLLIRYNTFKSYILITYWYIKAMLYLNYWKFNFYSNKRPNKCTSTNLYRPNLSNCTNYDSHSPVLGHLKNIQLCPLGVIILNLSCRIYHFILRFFLFLDIM